MRPLLILAIVPALAGCGGGGAGFSLSPRAVTDWLSGGCSVGSSTGQINYRTEWPAAAPATSSQLIQVLDGAGTVVRTESVNRGGASVSTLDITGLAGRVYEVRSTLYSAASASGTMIGSMRAMADICGAPAVSVQAASGPATSLSVFPEQVSVTTAQSVRIVPMPRTDSGRPAFLAGSPSFSGSGVVSVGTNGVASAAAAGAGEARAAWGSLSAAGAVTATTFVPVTRKWTVLVYLNAANDLFFASDLNMNQMEQVAGNPDVRFVVQWKQTRSMFPSSSFDGVRRYLVQPDNTSALASTLLQSDMVNSGGNALDMGDPQTLKDFIAWGKVNYPAERYALVIWNHGNGWRRAPGGVPQERAFSYDDQYGTSIQTWEIDDALQGQNFDIVAWDCSLMQMLEVARELRDFTDYVVGSEESPPAEGYPYHLIFDDFRDNPNAPTATLARAFVDGMLAHPPYTTRKITQSVIDTSRINALTAAVDSLGIALQNDVATLGTAIPAIRSEAQAYSSTATRVYRDLWDICRLLRERSDVSAAVKSAALAVQNAITSAVIHEGNNANSPNSHGVSIDFSGNSTFASGRSDYLRLKLAQETSWDEWLGMSPD
ncbi:MAG: clostripain-related cysteine peptidase [Fimbriimonadaceae bacterium]|nr:clostripain-related cysteine peptidase [Fimbriimonadaceae bacterium]